MSNGPGDHDETPEPGGDNPFKGTPFEQIFSSFGGGGMPNLAGLDLGALMGQMQSLMQPYDGPVTWQLPTAIARRTAAQEPAPSPDRAAQTRVADAFRLADHWLDDTTALPSGITTTAAWSRADWIEETTA